LSTTEKATTTRNEFSKLEENNAPLWKRLWVYQRERFPLLGHGLLVVAFSFSAISYSRICRGVEDFVDLSTFLVGVFTTVSMFLMVRIFDEFKDAEDDAKFRRHLPVPRGLISFRELRIISWILVAFQLILNAFFFPKMLVLYGVAMGYLLLMRKEFFIAEWLKKNQFWYVISHMLIIPLIDVYATGLDWLLENATAPIGLLFFFAVSFMNGIVLEIGRKIKTPEDESVGVLTYTSMVGTKRAVYLWILILMATLLLSILAAHYAGFGMFALLLLGFIFLLLITPAISFLRKHTTKSAKMIEYASALWTIAMYFALGGIPMLQKLLFT